MPSYPENFLAWKESWKGWSEFLKYKKYQFLEFDKAKKFLSKYDLKSSSQFFKLRKTNNDIRMQIPVSPIKFYKKEWKGYGDFLNYNEKKFMGFEEGKKIVQELGIKSRPVYWEKRKKLKILLQIPHSPNRAYKEWKGWDDFLVNKFVTYQQAKKIAQEMKIERALDYKKLAIEKKLPEGMPMTPRIFYKKVWKDWDDFLGKQRLLSYEETSKIAQKLGIKSSKQYREYFDLGKLPRGMPREPNVVFRYRGENQ